jgi:uncharacterized protein involved in exopolysaccharide biosynthesis/Mrp family chromosome partitioning ATPase
MVRDNRGTVFAIAGLVFVLVMAHCLTSRMTFRSTARIYLGETEGKAQPTNSGNNIDITAGSSEASSEIEVLRSRNMVRRGIIASGLNVSIVPPGWKAPRYWQWLWSKRNPALLDVAADEVIATDTALDEGVLNSRSYRVRFVDSVTYTLKANGMRAVTGHLHEPLKVPGLTLTLLPGRIGPQPGARYDMTVEPLEGVVERVVPELTVSTPKSAGTDPVRVLTLEFTSTSRLLSASFLSHLMQVYLETRHAWKTEDASAAERFVTEQLRTMQQSLDRTQEKLAEYRADNRVVVQGNEADAMVAQMNRYEDQRVAATLQVSALRDIKRALKSSDQPLESYMIGEADDAMLRQLAASLSTARERLSALRGVYNDQAPELRQQTAQVNDQLAAIRRYVDGRLVRAEKNVGTLGSIIGEYEAKLRGIPGAQLGLARIGRETDVYSKMYSYLLERQQQAAITKASTVSKNRILDLPQVPAREDSPKFGLQLASGLLGILLGAAVVILRGLFSTVFRREHDVRGVLGHLQVFARVPLRPSGRLRSKSGEDAPTFPMFDVMSPEADAAYAESFRSLRTNLYRALPGEHGKVVLVTSPMPSDGKTTCTLSLAAMLAADNRRVLVIDADVRRPTHHNLLGVPQSPGLRELILQKPGAAKSAIRTLCLSVGWIDAVTCSDGASAELLSANSFAAFLVEARSRYDFIMLDSPSYPVVSDPLVLAPLSDFVLSVMRLGNTPRKLAEAHLTGMFSAARGYAIVVNNAESALVPGAKNPRQSPYTALPRN